jgi:hypothetical protein
MVARNTEKSWKLNTVPEHRVHSILYRSRTLLQMLLNSKWSGLLLSFEAIITPRNGAEGANFHIWSTLIRTTKDVPYNRRYYHKRVASS